MGALSRMEAWLNSYIRRGIYRNPISAVKEFSETIYTMVPGLTEGPAYQPDIIHFPTTWAPTGVGERDGEIWLSNNIPGGQQGWIWQGSSWLGMAGGAGGSTYTLPIASASVLGGIKVGAGLSIDGSGVLSGAAVAGSDSQVQFNDGGAFGASSTFAFSKNAVVTSILNGALYVPQINLTATNAWWAAKLFWGARIGWQSSDGSSIPSWVTTDSSGAVLQLNGGTSITANNPFSAPTVSAISSGWSMGLARTGILAWQNTGFGLGANIQVGASDELILSGYGASSSVQTQFPFIANSTGNSAWPSQALVIQQNNARLQLGTGANAYLYGSTTGVITTPAIFQAAGFTTSGTITSTYASPGITPADHVTALTLQGGGVNGDDGAEIVWDSGGGSIARLGSTGPNRIFLRSDNGVFGIRTPDWNNAVLRAQAIFDTDIGADRLTGAQSHVGLQTQLGELRIYDDGRFLANNGDTRIRLQSNGNFPAAVELASTVGSAIVNPVLVLRNAYSDAVPGSGVVNDALSINFDLFDSNQLLRSFASIYAGIVSPTTTDVSGYIELRAARGVTGGDASNGVALRISGPNILSFYDGTSTLDVLHPTVGRISTSNAAYAGGYLRGDGTWSGVYPTAEDDSGDTPNGLYEEVTGSPFPTAITWWTSSGKTVKVKETLITRNANKTPATITYKFYVAGSLTKTLTDTLTYSGAFETSRTRVVT